MRSAPRWPKHLPSLNAEQQRISDDFMAYWHEVLPKRFGLVEVFNQGYPVAHSSPGFRTTLEVGAGSGEHLEHERLSPEQRDNYYALDIRPNMIAQLQKRFPDIRAFAGDVQQRVDFPDGFFDRILAIHILEHLPDLPSCVRELYRLCNKQRGELVVVIPCEGGWAYSFARKISAQRVFEKRYKQPYRWFISREHLSRPHEILEELERHFQVRHRRYSPFPFLPTPLFNLGIGLRLTPR